MGQFLTIHPAQYLAQIKKADVKDNIKAMWLMPYDADPLLEPELVGLTWGQVILLSEFKQAAKGHGASVDRLLDRMIGKPEMINKNLNVTGSYKDWLEEVAKEEGIIDTHGRIIETAETSPALE